MALCIHCCPSILFLLPDQRYGIVKNMCIYAQSDCLETLYELALLPNNTAVKHFYTNRERCEVLTGYL
jgi:hypothetical protein